MWGEGAGAAYKEAERRSSPNMSRLYSSWCIQSNIWPHTALNIHTASPHYI